MSDIEVLEMKLWRLKDEHARTENNPRKRVLLEKLILEVLDRIERQPREKVSW